MTDERSLAARSIISEIQEDTWRRVERYIDWKSSMVVAASYLCVAIHALEQSEFGLAGLKNYPDVEDFKLRLDIVEYEDKLTEIKDMLIKAQTQLRENARKEFAYRTDRMEDEE